MSRPLSLIIVAGLFILVGAEAAWQTIAKSSPGHLFINPLLLSIFVGIGLFRLGRVWRYIALTGIWFLIVMCAINFVAPLMFPANQDIYTLAAFWSAMPVLINGTNWGFILALLLLGWMRWVLARKDVYDLFTGRDA